MYHRVYHSVWPFIKILIIIVFAFIIAGCASGYKPSTEVYVAHCNPELTSEETATILMLYKYDTIDYVDWVTIGDELIEHKKYGTIIIKPGSYRLGWGRKFVISPMIKASGSEKRTWSADVTLDAGHVYVIHAKRTIGHGYRIYSWITDETSWGKIIWGTKYIPGPYDYMRRL